MLFIYWVFLLYFPFPYFTPRLFCFFCIRLLICPRAFSSWSLVDFSLVILEWPVLIVLLDPVSVSFKSPFFRQYLLIYIFKLHFKICQQICICFFLILPIFSPCLVPLLFSSCLYLSFEANFPTRFYISVPVPSRLTDFITD